MENKNSDKNWLNLIKRFKPYSGFELEDYYGVSMIKTKGENKYRIKLIYDYTNNSKMSVNQIEVAELDRAMKVYEILDKHSVDKGSINRIDDLFLDNTEGEFKF